MIMAHPILHEILAIFLMEEEVEVMQWPAQSPDLKTYLGPEGAVIRDMDSPPTTVARLQEALLQTRGTLTPEIMEVLVRSMPRRLRAVMTARGGHTQYQVESRRPDQIQCSLKISIQFSLRFVTYDWIISETSPYDILSKSAIFHLHVS